MREDLMPDKTEKRARARQIVAFSIVFFLACFLHGQPETRDLFGIQLRKIKDGIYLASRPEPLRPFVEGNVTIIINEHDVVVVDAGGSPRAAENVIAEIRRLTANPVRYVVNTHIHRDHRFGNQEYLKAFPGAEIVAHPGVRDIIMATNPKWMNDLRSRIEAPQRQVEEEVRRLRAEGRPGNDKIVAHLERFLSQDIQRLRQEYRSVVNTPPTVTVEQKMVLHRGPRTIEILFLGPGDTPHDVVVYLPQDKVVCSGDMVVHPFPYGYSEQPLEWLTTLGKLAELDFDTLIPGHGEAQQGKSYLRTVISLLQLVRDQVRSGIAAGLDLEGVRARIDLSGFERDLVGEDPVYRYYFREDFVEPHVERTFSALQQRPGR
jgi:glyoxylase-like metal-dependent hydrolase (beta-lactamase superfamily II)